MNYNRGCYPRQNPPTIQPRQRAGGYTPNRHLYTDNGKYDTAHTADMNYRLASVYAPYQEWQNIYNGEKALENGTIFAELDKPFYGYKCNKGGCSL